MLIALSYIKSWNAIFSKVFECGVFRNCLFTSNAHFGEKHNSFVWQILEKFFGVVDIVFLTSSAHFGENTIFFITDFKILKIIEGFILVSNLFFN
jgi:hypothetical protein